MIIVLHRNFIANSIMCWLYHTLVFTVFTIPFITAFEQRTCIGNTVSIRCPTFDYLPVIEAAVYGPDDTCGEVTTPCEDSDALSKVISKCHGQPRCSFTLNHNEFSGECEESDANRLVVTYSCVEETSIQDICSTTRASLNSEGYLKSPGYPDSYPANMDCQLNLSPDPAPIQVEIIVLDWDFELDDCSDRLEVIDNNYFLANQFCGVFSAGRGRTISFTDGSIAFKSQNDGLFRRGFLIYYSIYEEPVPVDEIEMTTIPESEFSGDESEITEIDEGFFTTHPMSSTLKSTTIAVTEAEKEIENNVTTTVTTSTTTVAIGWGRHTTTTSTTTTNTPSLMENSTTTKMPNVENSSSATPDLLENSTSPVLMENSTTTSPGLMENATTLATTTFGTTTLPVKEYQAEVCTGQRLRISCPDDHLIVVKRAVFGYGITPQCGSGVRLPTDTCSTDNAMHKVARACSGLQVCSQRIGLQIANGDCVNAGSKLEVTYICEHVGLFVDICSDKELRPDKGYITSPRYPLAYGKGKTCERNIVPPAGFLINIQVLDVEMEARRTSGCYDFLYIRNPNNPAETTQYCGDMYRFDDGQLDYVLEEVDLFFVSDGLPNSFKGFLMYFQVISSKDITTTTIPTTTTQLKIETTTEPSTTTLIPIITSTSVPVDEDRSWSENGVTYKDACIDAFVSITCSNEETIIIENASFGTRPTTECSGNSLTACSQNDVTSVITELSTGRKECSFRVNEETMPIHCQHGSLLVGYQCVADNTIHDVCAGTTQLPPEGYLTSPGYPGPYSSNSICRSTLSPTDPTAYVTMTLLDLDMHSRSSSGCYDNIVFSDPISLSFYYKYCGDMENAGGPMRFNASAVEMEYRADAFNSGHRGFMFRYKVFGGTNGSSNALMMSAITTPQPSTESTTTTPTTTTSTVTTTISSIEPTTTLPPPVLFPSYEVSSADRCSTEVLELECIGSDEILVIEKATYHVEPGSCNEPIDALWSCSDDVTAEVSDRCSGFETCTFQLNLLFTHSKCFSENAGLTVEYMCVPAPIDICQPTRLSRPEGFIMSPAYPQPYPRSQNCDLDIKPRGENATVEIRFYDLDLYARQTRGCYESIQIVESNSPFHTYTLCGNLTHRSILLPHGFRYEHLQMTFVSHGRVIPHKGFLVYYRIENEDPLPETTAPMDTTVAIETTSIIETTTIELTTNKPTTTSEAQTTQLPTSTSRKMTSMGMDTTAINKVETTPSSSTTPITTPTTTSTTKAKTTTEQTTSTVRAETPKMTSSTVKSSTEGFDVDSGETTMSDMDEMTTTGVVIGGPKRSKSGGGGGGTDGGMIAGIVIALLLLIALIICGILFLRYRRKRNKPVQKPGRHDLWANTSSPTQDAGNEYTYVNMNGHGTAFEDNSKPLHAHESALSTPLYDDNKNRTFSRPPSMSTGVPEVTTNGVGTNQNGGVATSRDGVDSPPEVETSFAAVPPAGGAAAYENPAYANLAAEVPANENPAAYENPAYDNLEAVIPPSEEYSDTPSVSETESQDTVIQAAVANVIEPPKDFGESSTDAVANSEQPEGADGLLNVVKDPHVKLHRDRAVENDDDAELQLTPNPYASQSVV